MSERAEGPTAAGTDEADTNGAGSNTAGPDAADQARSQTRVPAVAAAAAPRESYVAAAYLRAKSVWRGRVDRRRLRRGSESEGLSSPFGKGRDPRVLGALLDTVVRDMGWSENLDQARIIEEWADFVGAATAEHTRVIGISDGVLEIQCDSTTWATELRRLRSEMLTRLLAEYPSSDIREMRFRGPGAPSWRHGPRTVPGRGPRDTYG